MSTPASWSTCWKSFSTATVFLDLGTGGAVATVADEPAPVLDSLAKNPELDAVMSAAQTILDFKTQAVRDIEAGPIKSNIEAQVGRPPRAEARAVHLQILETADMLSGGIIRQFPQGLVA